MLLEVKWGPYVKLVNEKVDICDNAESVDKKCPVKKGDVELKKEVSLPAAIPPVCESRAPRSLWRATACCEQTTNHALQGAYHVIADAFTKDDKRITCLKADVTFGKPSAASFFGSGDL